MRIFQENFWNAQGIIYQCFLNLHDSTFKDTINIFCLKLFNSSFYALMRFTFYVCLLVVTNQLSFKMTKCDSFKGFYPNWFTLPHSYATNPDPLTKNNEFSNENEYLYQLGYSKIDLFFKAYEVKDSATIFYNFNIICLIFLKIEEQHCSVSFYPIFGVTGNIDRKPFLYRVWNLLAKNS